MTWRPLSRAKSPLCDAMICHARILRDHVVETFLAIVRSGRARGAFQFDDLGLAARRLDEPVGGALALVDEVRADERDVVACPPWPPTDRRRGRPGSPECRLSSPASRPAQAAFLRAAGTRSGRRAARSCSGCPATCLECRTVGVGHDHLPAALRRDVLEALGFGETPRVVAFGLREADAQRLLGRRASAAARRRRGQRRSRPPSTAASTAMASTRNGVLRVLKFSSDSMSSSGMDGPAFLGTRY